MRKFKPYHLLVQEFIHEYDEVENRLNLQLKDFESLLKEFVVFQSEKRWQGSQLHKEFTRLHLYILHLEATQTKLIALASS